jgi:hypothetical protein
LQLLDQNEYLLKSQLVDKLSEKLQLLKLKNQKFRTCATVQLKIMSMCGSLS